MVLWAVLICFVVVGSLSPAASWVMVAVGRLHINDKLQHFCAYLVLSALPIIGFRDRRRGLMAGLSMFVLGILLEGGQHFSPGRAVELVDVLVELFRHAALNLDAPVVPAVVAAANGAGVGCGALLGLPIRSVIALL